MPISKAIVLSGPVERIYYSRSIYDNDPKRHKRLVERIQRLYLGSVVVTSQSETEVEHFNTLVECSRLVVNPRNMMLTQRQIWEVNMFLRLKRLVLVVGFDEQLLSITEMEQIGLHPNTKITYNKI